MDKISFGIAGLDDALFGGIPAGNLVLVSGSAGTGKSTLCMQFLVNNSLKGLRSIYVSTEQDECALVEQGKLYGWDMDGLIKSNLLRIVYVDILKDTSFVEKIRAVVSSFKPNLLAIDSLNTLSDFATLSDYSKSLVLKGASHAYGQGLSTVIPRPVFEKAIMKQLLSMFLNEIRSYKTTTLLISETSATNEYYSFEGASEFLVDGIILMKSRSIDDILSRTLEIKKMRYTKVNGGVKAYELSENGVTLPW